MNIGGFLLSLSAMNPVPPYFGTYNSPVGLLSIAANDLGVCSISFVEEASAGPISPIVPIVDQCITELHEYFEGKRQTFNVPLAPRGTPFEESVWMALLTVNYGATCSYLDIARRLSNPKAIRAV